MREGDRHQGCGCERSAPLWIFILCLILGTEDPPEELREEGDRVPSGTEDPSEELRKARDRVVKARLACHSPGAGQEEWDRLWEAIADLCILFDKAKCDPGPLQCTNPISVPPGPIRSKKQMHT